MFAIEYTYQYQYRYSNNKSFPMLVVRVSLPENPERAFDIDACLDCGAERCLFDGAATAAALGIDLLSGPGREYVSAAGVSLEARVHRLSIAHPDLGSFVLAVGLSTHPIKRNLLGRDFFSLFQIGFRERYQTFYIRPES